MRALVDLDEPLVDRVLAVALVEKVPAVLEVGLQIALQALDGTPWPADRAGRQKRQPNA
jgi:hypothetical protein